MTATNMCSNFGGKWDIPPESVKSPVNSSDYTYSNEVSDLHPTEVSLRSPIIYPYLQRVSLLDHSCSRRRTFSRFLKILSSQLLARN